jgi:O-antigen/teichoic acid export membrane protein
MVIARATSGGLVVQSVSLGLAFILQIILANLLGASEYGLYMLVLSYIAMLIPLTTIGVGESVVRLAAEYSELRAFGLLRGCMRFVTAVCLLNAGVVACLGAVAVLAGRAAGLISEGFTSVFLVGVLLLPFVSLAAPRKGALRALLKAWQSGIPDGIVRPLAILAFVGFTVFAFGSIDARSAMLSNVIAAGLALLVGTFLLRRAMPVECAKADPEMKTKAWIRLSVPFAMLAWTYAVLHQVDVVVIGWLRAPAEVGIYSAAHKLASVITFGMSAVCAISAPLISRAFSASSPQRLRLVALNSVRLVCLLTILPTILIVALGDELLGLFGSEFLTGKQALTIFAVGYVVNACIGGGIAGFMLTMTGHQSKAVLIVATAAALNLVLNLLLVPRFGIEGAALATSVSLIVMNLIKLVVIGRHMHFYPTIMARAG